MLKEETFSEGLGKKCGRSLCKATFANGKKVIKIDTLNKIVFYLTGIKLESVIKLKNEVSDNMKCVEI